MADIIATQAYSGPPRQEPNEPDEHYLLRVNLWQRNQQYDAMKRRFTWAAGVAVVATAAAVALGVRGRR